MKKIFFIIILNLLTIFVVAQTNDGKEVFTFAINNYIINSNDSICIVQVELPNELVKIDEKQLGLLKHNFTNSNTDTNTIGHGRCNLIKDNYYYFGIKLYNKMVKPTAKDVLYTKISYPAKYKGNVYNLIKKAIYFTRITEEKFYNFETALQLTKNDEDALIDSLVADIQYTGKLMQQEIPTQNKTIEGGLFTGKKLFDAMQICTAADVKKFIDYVIARPTKYAGNTWKISETFATWVDAETPTVIK